MDTTELCFTPATELAELIAHRSVSPVEVVDAFLERIDRVDRVLNSFCTLTPESARREAKAAEAAVMRGASLGPLHGVPVAHKDVLITKGVRTTRGSRIFENFIPQEDA